MNKDFHTVRGYENISMNRKLLTPSMEDYLEMIYRCSRKKSFMRLNELAQKLNVRDSSASKMVKKLGELKLVKYEKYGVIVITEDGERIGEYLLQRHNIIESFLEILGGGDEILTETELIEHIIGSETVKNISLLNKFFDSNKDILSKFIEFKKYNL